MNLIVKCRDYEIPVIREVDTILSAETHINHLSGGITYKLPFQNVCYRPLIRVVDFYPPDLEDFAVQIPMPGYGNDDDDLGPQYTTWEWRFCLLAEGTDPTDSKQPRELMKIFVHGGEGVHLLGLDPDEYVLFPKCGIF